MFDIPIPWKEITRGLPKVKRYADDRAPTFEEIQKICDYPDRRMKAPIFTMSSSGIRLGAWDYLQWKHIIPIEDNGKISAAKIVVYGGTEEEYFSFITPEAFYELEKWMNFRREFGEVIDEDTWLMIQLWSTKNMNLKNKKIKTIGIRQLVMRSLRTQGLRNKKRKQSNNLQGTRYEFQTNHGFRKWFKTRCELAGMKSINIEKLMGHSIGISDSYYRVTESEFLGRFQQFVSKGWLAISNIKHKELVTQMRMARYKDNGNLDKEETNDNTFDSFDATRCALMQFRTAGVKNNG